MMSQAASHESQPLVAYLQVDIEGKDVLALLRLCWRVDGKIISVEELCVFDTPEGYEIVAMALERCPIQKIDLMIMSPRDPEQFGIREC
jgi:hypothetical protein